LPYLGNDDRWSSLKDCHVEIERSVSTEEGVREDATLLDVLLRNFGDPIEPEGSDR
jgi:hypothetical protein